MTLIKYSNYFLYLAFSSAEFSSAATLARVVGLSALFGSKAFLLEHSPSSTNSMSCSIKALICHLCCLFAISAMTKTPSTFSLLPIILKENKRKPGTNIIITWKKQGLGPVQTWETDSAVSSIWTFFALNYCRKKKKVPNQVTWMAS